MRGTQGTLGKPATAHAGLVATFVRQFPAAQTTGFMRSLAKLPGASYTQDLIANDREWKEDVSIVPDAFVIDADNRAVILFEAVVTSDLTPEKLAKIEEIGWAIDQDGYTIGVVRGSAYGRALLDPVVDALTESTAFMGCSRGTRRHRSRHK